MQVRLLARHHARASSPCPPAANALLFKSLSCGAQLSQAMGQQQQAAKWTQLSLQVKSLQPPPTLLLLSMPSTSPHSALNLRCKLPPTTFCGTTPLAPSSTIHPPPSTPRTETHSPFSTASCSLTAPAEYRTILPRTGTPWDHARQSGITTLARFLGRLRLWRTRRRASACGRCS